MERDLANKLVYLLDKISESVTCKNNDAALIEIDIVRTMVRTSADLKEKEYSDFFNNQLKGLARVWKGQGSKFKDKLPYIPQYEGMAFWVQEAIEHLIDRDCISRYRDGGWIVTNPIVAVLFKEGASN
jgi:hypothetical protein